MGLVFSPPNPFPQTSQSRSTQPLQGHVPYFPLNVVSSPDHQRVPFMSRGHTWYSHKAPPEPHPHTSPSEFTLPSNRAVLGRTTTYKVPTPYRFPSLHSDPETDFISVCEKSPPSLLRAPSFPPRGYPGSYPLAGLKGR